MMMMRLTVVTALLVLCVHAHNIFLDVPSMGTVAFSKFYRSIVDSVVVPGQCTSVQLAACQAKFNNVSGISDSNDFTDPYRLASDIDKVLTSNQRGYAQVCNARAIYQNCLGTDNYNACLDPRYYWSLGYNDSTANAYQAIFRQLEFSCIQGLQVGTDAFTCIVGTFINQMALLMPCTSAYANSVNQCDDTRCLCSAAAVYGSCVGNVTASYCKKTLPAYTAPGGWWACGFVNADAQTYNCQNACKVSEFAQSY